MGGLHHFRVRHQDPPHHHHQACLPSFYPAHPVFTFFGLTGFVKLKVMVDPADLAAFLRGGEDDGEGGEDEDGSSGDGGELQHHAGADKALGALLGLKKSGRKKGALEAQRQEYQIRLRALDLLEVCRYREESWRNCCRGEIEIENLEFSTLSQTWLLAVRKIFFFQNKFSTRAKYSSLRLFLTA